MTEKTGGASSSARKESSAKKAKTNTVLGSNPDVEEEEEELDEAEIAENDEFLSQLIDYSDRKLTVGRKIWNLESFFLKN